MTARAHRVISQTDHKVGPETYRMLDARTPSGAINEHWDNHRTSISLVSPANKRRFTIIVVGTGLAGAAAAATLGELGYRVRAYTFHDSARRAHSIAAQGGINAAKNYPNDGDSIHRLFYDTVKGGDYRSRESNVLPARPNSRWKSSINAPRRAFPSPGNTGGSWRTVPSAGLRYPAPSTPGARPASNSCSGRTRR